MLHHAQTIAAQIAPHLTSPNPRVGCVITHNGKIISTGVHERLGEPHAEAQAINKLLALPFKRTTHEIIAESEIFVTLEPCHHFEGKKTPSCTDLLLKHKPKRLVIGSLDPQFKGKNAQILQNAGINVEICSDPDCQALNPFFEKFITTKTPYVTVKIAQSLNGQTINPKGPWISNEASRNQVHHMRAQYSAILTTEKTILSDNPTLDCRLPKNELPHPVSNPQVIILGKKENLPPDSNIFAFPKRKLHFSESKDLSAILKRAGELSIDSIMTECGTTLASTLIKEDLVDQIDLFIAPNILPQTQSAFKNEKILSQFTLSKTKNLDGDIHIQYTKKCGILNDERF